MAKAKAERKATRRKQRGGTTTSDPALIARFKGLTHEQIKGLLVADELARHAHDQEIIDAVVARYRELLGNPPTFERMRAYAKEAEKVGMNGVAYAWYEAIARRVDASPDERGLFGAFLIRMGCIEEAEEHGVPIDAHAMRRAADIRTRKAQGDSFDELESALQLYRTIADKRGIRAVLRKALSLEDKAMARKAAHALGRDLTRDDLLRIARQQIHRDTLTAARFIIAHQLRELRRPCIMQMLRDDAAWIYIARWSKRLGITPTVSDVERYHTRMRSNGIHWQDVEASGRALAQRSPRWRRRMPEVYAYCRNQACAWYEAEAAERYGKKINQPLTVPELMRIAEHCSQRSAEHVSGLDWANERRRFCLDLAAQRIAEAVGNPPPDPHAKVEEERAAA